MNPKIKYAIFLIFSPLALIFYRIPGIDFSLSYDDFKKEIGDQIGGKT